MFVNLDTLKCLSLHDKYIRNIDVASFVNLVNLEELYLQNNRLSTLDAEVFSSQGKLRNLGLAENLFQDLNVKYFEPLANLQDLELLGNLLICTCDLADVWLFCFLRAFRSGATCRFPQSPAVRNASWDGLLYFNCKTAAERTEDTSVPLTTLHVLTSLLLVLVLVVIVLLVTMVIVVKNYTSRPHDGMSIPLHVTDFST
jgi:hypothetical protein